MIIDNWHGTSDDKSVIERPSIRQVEAAIRQLDGQRRTMVVLEGKGDSHLTVGGGKDRFVVYATEDNQSFSTLLDPSRSENEVEMLVAGGQLGDYPSNVCVSLELALQAARTYAQHGHLDTSLVWQLD